MPEGGNVGWYSDWFNDGAGGGPQWETFHLCELRGILERDYRAGTERAIAGLSMGGMGATSYAARHPGMFRAAASFSGMLTTEKNWAAVQLTLSLQGFGATDLWGSGNPADSDRRLDVWAKHDPFALADQLVSIPVFVSSGNGDPGPLDTTKTSPDLTEQTTYAAAQDFSEKLGALGGNLTTDFYGAGTHSWPYWEQELHRAFPMLMQAIGAE
jgi:diacylglycerol O-acyltransferase/trehalose O-mycolyltransferase